MQPDMNDDEVPAPVEVPDAEAPYGRNPRTGKPYKLPEDERLKRAETLVKARAASNATFQRRREAAESGPVDNVANDDPAAALADRTPIDRAGQDRAPEAGGSRRRKGRGRPAAARSSATEDVPPFRAGPIAAGMNRLYVRAGKILRALDWDIGTAAIAMTRKESDDDVTVGEAWEEFARVYPKHRVWITKLIQGGVAGQLLMVHAPLFLAILLKDSVRRHLPLARLWSAVLDDDGPMPADPGPGDPVVASPGMDLGAMFGGMNSQDMSQAYAFAQGLMGGSMGRIVDMTGGRTPTVDETDQAA